MTLKIDKAGRIVLPKPIRQRLGLRVGAALEVRETVEGLVIQPVKKRPSLVRAGRFLVHTGKLPPNSDILRELADDRDERLRKLAGL